MALVGKWTLKEALNHVECSEQMPVYDAVFKPTTPTKTAKGEEYLRESRQDIDSLMSKLGVSASAHTAIWESVALALENAFLRGNNADSKLEVIVRVYEGLAGKVVQIIDSGKGFDYNDIIRKAEADENYAQGRGKGLQVMNAAPIIAGYEGKGNIINITIMNKDLE